MSLWWVEKTAIQTVPNVNAVFSVEVSSGLLEHHAEECAKESWCKDTAHLHAVVDGECLRYVAIQADLSLLVSKRLDNHR